LARPFPFATLATAALVLILASPPGAGQLAGEGLPVQVGTRSGVRDGRLVGWDAQGPLLEDGPAPYHWFEIRLGGPVLKAGPWKLELVGGGWLSGAPGGGEGDQAFWRVPAGTAVPLDMVWVRRLARDSFRSWEVSDRDLLWLKTSGQASLDRRSGWFHNWKASGVQFEGVEGLREFPWSRVAGLRLLDEEVPPFEGGVWLLLAGGGKLAARPLGLHQGSLVVALPWLSRWEVPLASLRGIRRRGDKGSLVDLGERQPQVVQKGPQGVFPWTPRRGWSVEGRPLRVAGREYASGFGTRVPTELVFSGVGPGDFVCRVGVDDEVAGFRRPRPVRFRVLFRGREVAASPVLEAGDKPLFLRARLDGEGELRLVAEPAAVLPFGGHAHWLDPLWFPVPAKAGPP